MRDSQVSAKNFLGHQADTYQRKNRDALAQLSGCEKCNAAKDCKPGDKVTSW